MIRQGGEREVEIGAGGGKTVWRHGGGHWLGTGLGGS